MFEPWATVLVDRGRELEFLGAYQLAFPLESGEASAPSLCLRRSTWRRGVEDDSGNLWIEGEGEGTLDSTITFTHLGARPDVVAAVAELVATLEGGITFRRTSRTVDWRTLSCSLADERGTWSVSYGSSRAESAELEAWLPRWREALAREEAGISPDDGCRVSYRASVSELLERQRG